MVCRSRHVRRICRCTYCGIGWDIVRSFLAFCMGYHMVDCVYDSALPVVGWRCLCHSAVTLSTISISSVNYNLWARASTVFSVQNKASIFNAVSVFVGCSCECTCGMIDGYHALTIEQIENKNCTPHVYGGDHNQNISALWTS